MTLAADVFEKAASGDQEAIAQLLHVYGPLVRQALSISPLWQATVSADDVMQVTYLEAFLRFPQQKPFDAESVTAWLTRVAKNNLKDAIKELDRAKRPNLRRRVRTLPDEDSYFALAELVAATTGSAPTRCASKRENQELLEAAIQRLPSAYEQVVRMCDLAERPTRDVAEALGRSVAAVKMMRMRAHDRLGELLGTGSSFFSSYGLVQKPGT